MTTLMHKSFDKLSDIPAMVDTWAEAALAGSVAQAHQLALRLTTLPRFRQAGLDALVARCAAGDSDEGLTAGLLRQLGCSAANRRGGLHARKYAVTVGLSLRWLERDSDGERSDGVAWAAYSYWLEALKSRGMVVGAMGKTSAVDLQTQARFLMDHQMAPAVPELSPQYTEWLEERGATGQVDDTLCWMLGCAHTQTLWVTTQATDAVRQSMLRGQADPLFLQSIAREVQGAWREAVEQFLSLWATADPEKLRKPIHERQRTPWVSMETSRKIYPDLLATLAVSAPLEPFAAWQRQQTQGFLHGLVDGVFYANRTTGVLGLFPARDRLFSLAWATTHQPRVDEYAKELSSNRGEASDELTPLPRDTLDALWHAAQQYWDSQGELLAGAEGAPGGASLMAERSHGWLPVPWNEQSREWVLAWAKELPHTVKVWCPADIDVADAGLRVPLPPVHLLQVSPGATQPRDAEVAEDPPAGSATLEEVIFGTHGRDLVTTAQRWEPGFAGRAQRRHPRMALAHDCGLEVAIEQGLPRWLSDAFTERGRAVLGAWLRQCSPAALCNPSRYARNLVGLPEADARALAEWLRSSALYEMHNTGFAWTVAALLNTEHVRRLQVSSDALAHLQNHQAPRESLCVQDVLQVGPWAMVEFDDDAQPACPNSVGEPPRHTFFRGIQLWSQALSKGAVQWVIATNERTVVEVRPGDRTGNSALLGDGRRERWVDWHYQETLPAVTPATRLVDLWCEIEKQVGRPATERTKAAVEHLAQLGRLLEQGWLARSPADLMLAPVAPATTLDDVFRRRPTSAPDNVFAGAVLFGWCLGACTGSPPVEAAPNGAQVVKQGAALELAPSLETSRCAPRDSNSKQESLRLSLQARLHLGQLLRQSRQTMGLTAKAVANDALGLPAAHASVGRIERGCLESVSLPRLLKLLAFYGLELDQVMARSRSGAVAWSAQASGAGARFRSLREALGLTPAAFAAWAAVPNLSAVEVEKVEMGQVAPRADVVDHILGKQPSLCRSWLLAQRSGHETASSAP